METIIFTRTLRKQNYTSRFPSSFYSKRKSRHTETAKNYCANQGKQKIVLLWALREPNMVRAPLKRRSALCLHQTIHLSGCTKQFSFLAAPNNSAFWLHQTIQRSGCTKQFSSLSAPKKISFLAAPNNSAFWLHQTIQRSGCIKQFSSLSAQKKFSVLAAPNNSAFWLHQTIQLSGCTKQFSVLAAPNNSALWLHQTAGIYHQKIFQLNFDFVSCKYWLCKLFHSHYVR